MHRASPPDTGHAAEYVLIAAVLTITAVTTSFFSPEA
jgi:hypothetical protein